MTQSTSTHDDVHDVHARLQFIFRPSHTPLRRTHMEVSHTLTQTDATTSASPTSTLAPPSPSPSTRSHCISFFCSALAPSRWQLHGLTRWRRLVSPSLSSSRVRTAPPFPVRYRATPATRTITTNRHTDAPTRTRKTTLTESQTRTLEPLFSTTSPSRATHSGRAVYKTTEATFRTPSAVPSCVRSFTTWPTLNKTVDAPRRRSAGAHGRAGRCVRWSVWHTLCCL